MPGASLLVRALTDNLGPDPVADGLNACGELAIKCLLLCLACTPLRIVAGWTLQMRARKHLGLLAFGYALAHFSVYLFVDHRGAIAEAIKEMLDKPFTLVGLAAFTLLLPLAFTSTKGAIKRLGGKRWNRLHQLVYVVGVLAVIHYVMRAKKDATEAMIHGAILAVLLAVRVWDKVRRRVQRSVTA